MKYAKSLFSLAMAAALAMLYISLTGCEKDASTDTGADQLGNYTSDPRTFDTFGSLEISPNIGTISAVGQQIRFSAVGGSHPYSWSVANSSAGTISVQENSQDAIYTATLVTKNTVVVRDNLGKAATVAINGSAGGLSITPSAVTLSSGFYATNNVPPSDLDGHQIQFTVSGGTPPYGDWTSDSPQTAIINSSGLMTITVGAGFAMGNVGISVKDSAGTLATATVTLQWHQ